jgi:hypothetical protein
MKAWRGFAPIELYDVWVRCFLNFGAVVPEPPAGVVMTQAVMSGTITNWFPCIGQRLEA